ncbi:SRPBCC family protein [Olleya sp. HaHaR_3_96]|uniref:SRPBCC family protein n=1 Tax=Olleya sp. HaHaR_3_96 TaxID=2745560 RepID=UPI001C4E7949|nr:SRPBCC family protein [Olleya sp. HaHaR_3_96]QXP61764.1 SRPBCC family protein [Olleya sp. HaHaR_3_96]
MKYTTKIIINKPVLDCFSLLEDHSNIKYWQEGLESYEHISGDLGEIGSKIKLNYVFGKRQMSLTETITGKEKGKVIHFNFDTSGMHNIQENYFEALDDNTTKWVSTNHFAPTKFKSHLMLTLMPKAFKKQSKKYLNDFKKFAENETLVIK